MPQIQPTREQTHNAVTHYVGTVLSNGNDPRAVLESLLVNASSVASMILEAGRAPPASMAAIFGQALVDALLVKQDPDAPAQGQLILNGSKSN